ncbi:hypothetical protein GDO86_013378 [Hymenochirus boettgeri]|uniref:RRM domain-containing protein n=2 Tax=Hymenochirus boettgeri TaxID=247094 RepID=A0A8T2IUK8_9PIPI|nr:hypothetical protein GDO86_013378 [Hymenochirus boettgeri]
MAARWGAGEETLTIGGMELFTAGSPLQCNSLEEQESCSDLSDLTLDTGGFLGAFHGFVDHSIISIIDDPGAQPENKGHFDEENELSLLTALTEILDNADDENMSPFDTIPDTELLVSPKENSALQRFLCLSRTPPEREVPSVDEQNRINCMFEARTVGQSWEFLPEGITCTPKRLGRHRNIRGCLPRILRKELTQQRSDGEDEEVQSPEKNNESNCSSIIFEPDFLVNSVNKENEMKQETLRSTPCIINTENVALNELVKYMHPYCLPSVSTCLEPKDSEKEEIQDEGIFLEIVSNGECIKLPILIEPAVEMFESESLESDTSVLFSPVESNSEVEIQTNSGELRRPVHGHNDDAPTKVSNTDAMQSTEEFDVDIKGQLPSQSSEMQEEEHVCEAQKCNVSDSGLKNATQSIKEDRKTITESNKKFQPTESDLLSTVNDAEAWVAQKVKSSVKVQHSKNSRVKKNDSKQQGVFENAQNTSLRSSNPPLQESDFLVKQLDQLKDFQVELKSSKMLRARGRARVNADNSSCSDKMLHNEKLKKAEKLKEKETKIVSEIVDSAKCSSQNSKELSEEHKDNQPAEVIGSVMDQSDQSKGTIDCIVPDVLLNTSSDLEEKNTIEVEKDTSVSQLLKESKKSLSLSEYRKRMQQRKPNLERENESASESKWPTIPEPPTELAEIPCLVVPGKEEVALKQAKEKKSEEKLLCSSHRTEELCGMENSSKVNSVSLPPIQPTAILETPSNQPDVPCHPIGMDIPQLSSASQPNLPPPPYYTPTWPTVPLQPPFYPNIPLPPAVPHFSNGIPHDPLHALPVLPPPPVGTWPPFPPPPHFSMGSIPPPDLTVWGAALPPPLPYWPPAQQGVHGTQGALSERAVPLLNTEGATGTTATQGAMNTSNIHALQVPHAHPAPDAGVSNAPLQKCENPSVAPVGRENGGMSKLPKEPVKQKVLVKQTDGRSAKLSAQVNALNRKVNLAYPAKGDTMEVIPNLKISSLTNAKLNCTNPVVLKIMQILKNAQKLGFQITPPSPKESDSKAAEVLSANLKLQPHVTSGKVACQPVFCEEQQKVKPSNVNETFSSEPVMEQQQKHTEIFSLEEAVKICSTVPKMPEQLPLKPASSAPTQIIPPIHGNINVPLSATNNGVQDPAVENLSNERGIEASDLTSLLEQFEMSEANDEERLSQNPDLKVAVGNSGSEKTLEKKMVERLLAPELVNTAGLTPPATPPHQMWKPVPVMCLTGKVKPLHGNLQQRICSSPLKTAKLIDAKPLPQRKLRNKNPVNPVRLTGQPPIHVASGDHDYCIPDASKCLVTAAPSCNQPITQTVLPTQAYQCEGGSRWNVKHHQNITIKPIVPFGKRDQNKMCLMQNLSPETSSVCNQSILCSTDKSSQCSVNIQKYPSDPLDCRTNSKRDSISEKPSTSVLISPDASPCRSEDYETAAVGGENTCISRRSGRCYRKYRGSQSPTKSSGSHSRSSSSASSSYSRSRSPPSKRRRTYRSRNRHRSCSSSRSEYNSSSSRSLSSCSSRSCSPSSSQSRSRSRSPYRQRNRSRRCESRDSYYNQKTMRKERAIEERRVVYVGKINSQMTRAELRRRFSAFGDIEECTIHFREKGDNYGFVTYRYTAEAFDAIENGHKLRLPDELPFDLCFGGRRQFCKRRYADLDSNKDEFYPAPLRNKYENLDFDTLLKQAQKSIRR